MEPRRDRARDPLDLLPEPFVDVQRQARCACEELDRAVVVRRAEAAGDDAEVCAQALGERALELRFVVTDDRDGRGLEAEAYEFLREVRAVAVVAVPADELAAGDDDDAAQLRKTRRRRAR